jgi:hypothetical protein
MLMCLSSLGCIPFLPRGKLCDGHRGAKAQEAFLQAVRAYGIGRALERIGGWFIEFVGAYMKGRI